MYDEMDLRNKRDQIVDCQASPEEFAKQAKDSRSWIYRRSTAQWYTPEEFIRIFHGMRVKNRTRFFKDFYLHDPILGLRLKEKELQFFAKKIALYFDPADEKQVEQ